MLPANFVAGTARIDGRPVLIGADDFTVRGGSGDAAIHAKQVFSEQYANEMRLPVVRLLDGASGGGSVKTTHEAGVHLRAGQPGLGRRRRQPVAHPGRRGRASGRRSGLGAARLVMSHLAVMVTGSASCSPPGRRWCAAAPART